MISLTDDRIFNEVERAIKKYGTRNPFELLDAMGAVTRITHDFHRDGLKGYCAIMHRTEYVFINGNLPNAEQKVVAGHEAAHLTIHKPQIMSSPIRAMRDFNLYDNSGRIEREANSFLADFIVSDDDTLDVIKTSYDYFSAAQELYIPAPLFAFKLYSMMRRGYDVKNPVDLDSRFLGR